MQDKKTLTLTLTKCCKVLYFKLKTVRLLALIEEWIFLDKCPHKLDISFSQTLSLSGNISTCIFNWKDLT